MSRGAAGFRAGLLAGVSIVAIAVASQNVSAAPLLKRSAEKDNSAIVESNWTWWVEGGAFAPAGSAVGSGPLTGPFGVIGSTVTLPQSGGFLPHWGWEGAFGFDWKPPAFNPWHVSAQFRYGQAKKSKSSAANVAGTATTFFPFITFFGGTNTASQDLKEDHWLVDFAVGRDFGLGNSKAQWKAGIRVADLRAKLTTNGNVAGNATSCFFFGGCGPAFPFAGTSYAQQKSRFLGAGPRLGLEGETPLSGNWALDWQGGIAVLFGDRTLDQTLIVAAAGAPAVQTTLSSSSAGAVFNTDGQLGLSYWFTPACKLTASYRVDAYFNALRTVDSAGNVHNVNRTDHGPMLRLTTAF